MSLSVYRFKTALTPYYFNYYISDIVYTYGPNNIYIYIYICRCMYIYTYIYVVVNFIELEFYSKIIIILHIGISFEYNFIIICSSIIFEYFNPIRVL